MSLPRNWSGAVLLEVPVYSERVVLLELPEAWERVLKAVSF